MKKRSNAYPSRNRAQKGRKRIERTPQRTEKNPNKMALTKGMIVTGMLLMDRRRAKLIPLYGGSSARVYIDGVTDGYSHSDIVRAKIISQAGQGIYRASLTERLGGGQSARERMQGYILGFGLHTEFSAETLAEAERVSAMPITPEVKGTEDFRQETVFTIDGADAKDFDDAVSIKSLGDGLTRLSVHIADVSHYVKINGAIEQEAYLRGTSVYFPGHVLPMLPEALSNGCCSLRPDEDRLVLSCIMDVDGDGIVRAYRIVRGIIRSCSRLTYDGVNELLARGDQNAPLYSELSQMAQLAGVLHEKRIARGCVDIDLPEARIHLDEDGEVLDVTAPLRGVSERMIEEFMLLANETVARKLMLEGLPALYRVHETPDPEKIDALRRFAKQAGFHVRGIKNPVKPHQMQELLDQAKDGTLYRALSMLTMRSMQKARYAREPLGHFGLAAEDYCHFTSPIRRYPDLFVHRALGAMLDGNQQLTKKLAASAPEAAQRTSACEVTAMEAERAIDKMLCARWAQAHVDESFDAVITSVIARGFFAALDNTVEGMVPVSELSGDFFLDERTLSLKSMRAGVRFTVGQKIKIKIKSVESGTNRIDFTLDTDSLTETKK